MFARRRYASRLRLRKINLDPRFAFAQIGSVDIRFLFDRSGTTVEIVAQAAGVNLSTAYRWKHGAKCEWPHITRLFARGLLTVDDLRAAGLAIPRAESAA
jgi:hypothetical protein